MTSVTIAGLARQGGVGVKTVRYYQRRGLLDVPARSGGSDLGGGIRRYGADHVDRLRFIRSAQSAGFTLDEIGELLALDATDDRERARFLATTRLAALNQKIAELQAARDALEKLARRCASGSVGKCPIIEAFRSDGRDPGECGKWCRKRTQNVQPSV